MKKQFYILKSLVILTVIFTLSSAQANIEKTSNGAQVLYIQSVKNLAIESIKDNNTNSTADMTLTAKLPDETIHFTNNQDIKLGGSMTNDKFVTSFNTNAKEKGLHAVLVVDSVHSKNFYYTLLLKQATYNRSTQVITYRLQVLQSVGLAKSHNGTLSFKHGILFIDDACLTCGG